MKKIEKYPIDRILDKLWKYCLSHPVVVGGYIRTWTWDVEWQRNLSEITVKFKPYTTKSVCKNKTRVGR